MSDALAQRLFAGEERAGERFVDQHNTRGVRPICRREFATLPDLDTHEVEVSFPDDAQAHVGDLARLRLGKVLEGEARALVTL